MVDLQCCANFCSIASDSVIHIFIPFYFYLFIYFCLLSFDVVAISWAAPAAYGGSQARAPLGAVAAGPAPQPQPTPDPSRVCDLHHGSRQRWILNPLSEARDQTRVLVDAIRLRFRLFFCFVFIF